MYVAAHQERFSSTQWSLVAQVQDNNPQVRQDALDRLVRTYRPALLAHLVLRMRIEHSRAEDLVQSFFCEKVLARDLLARGDRNKGRLRSLLLKSLENFARTQLARDRRQGAEQSLDGEDGDARVLPMAGPRADEYDVAWARSVLAESLRRMWQECQLLGRKHIWAVLEARVLSPAMGGPAIGYDAFVERFGYRSPQAASTALITAKRQFKRVLEAVIAESVESDEEIEAELADLRRVLAHAAADHSAAFMRGLSSQMDEPRAIAIAAHESDPRLPAKLIGMRTDRDSLWSEADLRALMEHQLTVPLASSLTSLGGKADLTGSVSLNDLLADARPNLDFLKAVKKAAGRAVADKSRAITDEIPGTLYFASIALALVRHQQRITSSDDDVLRYGFGRMLDHAWMPEPLRQLFHQGLACLRPRVTRAR